MNVPHDNPILRTVRLHPFEILLLAKAIQAEADARRREGDDELGDLHQARAAELERVAQ